MSNLNLSALVGRLTQDAVLKQTEKGTFISNFCIAVNRARKVNDEWEEHPHYFYLNIFGKRAESLTPYLLKGQAVSIEGHLEQDRWETNGVHHNKTALVIDDIQLIGSVKKGAQAVTETSRDAPADEPGEIDIPDGDFDSDFDMCFSPEDMRE